jgi:hypothetical protein
MVDLLDTVRLGMNGYATKMRSFTVVPACGWELVLPYIDNLLYYWKGGLCTGECYDCQLELAELLSAVNFLEHFSCKLHTIIT